MVNVLQMAEKSVFFPHPLTKTENKASELQQPDVNGNTEVIAAFIYISYLIEWQSTWL